MEQVTKNELSIFLSKQAEIHNTEIRERLNKIATDLLTVEDVKEYLDRQIKKETPLSAAWFCLNDLINVHRIH